MNKFHINLHVLLFLLTMGPASAQQLTDEYHTTNPLTWNTGSNQMTALHTFAGLLLRLLTNIFLKH